MRKLLIITLLLVFAASTASAVPITISGSDSAAFQSWSTSNLNEENNNYYWDGKSGDGGQKNIGYYLTGSGGFSGTNYGTLSYWGMKDGSADLSFYVGATSASEVTLKLEIAGYAPYNAFGWYDIGTGTKHQLFSGPDSAGDTATITVSSNFGFYIDVLKPFKGPTFYTESWRNSTATDLQHFALFAEEDGGFWVAAEDLSLGDADYNDLVVHVTRVPVPEPSTLLLLGVGLVGLAGFRRKFRV